MKTYLIIFSVVFLLFSCSNTNKNEIDGIEKSDTSIETHKVEVIPILLSTFKKQIITNGKLSAIQKADIYFKAQGIIENIFVKNGDKILKGDTIAKLENKLQKLELASAYDWLNDAEIELNSLLIGYGGKMNDPGSIPEDIYENLKIQSGYNRAVNNINIAKLNFANTCIIAPFNGVIANIKAKNKNLSKISEPFCTLINSNKFETECSVIETEIPLLKNGQEVKVIPLSDNTKEIKGKIIEINPQVDKNGLILLKAIISNHTKGLFDGMNVKVIVETPINNQIVIPKEALVLRSNREVVFTYANGIAKWNYVNIAFENSMHYAISEGLKENDTLIVKGNLNLAHDAKVEIIVDKNF